MEHVGLSMAMGAFLAGVMLADSHFRHELEADIEPFRGVLLGLFFMAVGMSLDLKLVADNWMLLALAAPLLVLFKIAVVTSILRLSCSSWLEAIRAGALLSPAGEFAFVLLPLGLANGLLTAQQSAMITALAAISMLLGPVVAKLIDAVLLARIAPATMDEDYDGVGDSPVMVIGFGRFGQIVTQALLLQHIDVTVIDSDVERIRSAAQFGFKIYYGDGTRLDVLRAAGAGKARVICICVDDKQAALRIVEMVKAEFPSVRLHVRAYDRIHAIELMKANVDFQMRETFESALGFGRVTLETLGLTRDEAELVIDHVRDRDAQRMEIQFHEGLAAAINRVPRVSPEPLVPPKAKSKPLTPETRQVIEDGGAEVAVGGVGEPER
jgi:voltage-gated potassium channel Kch